MIAIHRILARELVAGILAFAVLLSSGCDSAGPTSGTTGTIEVDVSTSGASIDVDSNGYVLSVDGGAAQAIDVNARMTIPALATGNHVVRLDGVASNCSVAGTNPRSVDVVSDVNPVSPILVRFSVSCTVRIGSIRVSATTLGPEADADGYSVSVGGAARGSLASNGFLEIPGLPVGQTLVTLTGVAGNCAVDGSDSRAVNVALGATTDVAFTVRCVPQASLGQRAFIWMRDSGMIALPMLPGGTSSDASAINNLGQVVGNVLIGNRDHAFLWTPSGGMVDIGGLPGAVNSYATAINDAGQVAGYSLDADANAQAFRWSATEGMIALGVLPGTVSSFARGINSSGQVVGESTGRSSGQRPFRWTPGKGMEDLGSFDTDPDAGATAVSSSEDIAGFSSDGRYYGIERAVVWLANGVKKIIDGCGDGAFRFYGCYASANAINGAGEIAGSSEVNGPSHAFRWTVAGVGKDLGTLPGTNLSYALGINEGGDVVGTSIGLSFPQGHAFLWSPAGGMVDLGALAGRASSHAAGINNAGQVVGTSQ